jgi:hypothetical protein
MVVEVAEFTRLGLPSNVGSIQAQVNLQNQILAEELASHQARLQQSRLLEAQLSRMHQQHQQGSSSFQSSSAFQYHPHRLVSLSLCISNLLIGDYASPAVLYGLGSNVNLDQDGVRGSTSWCSPVYEQGSLFQPSFQSDRFGLDRWKAITATTTYCRPFFCSRSNALRLDAEALAPALQRGFFMSDGV